MEDGTNKLLLWVYAMFTASAQYDRVRLDHEPNPLPQIPTNLPLAQDVNQLHTNIYLAEKFGFQENSKFKMSVQDAIWKLAQAIHDMKDTDRFIQAQALEFDELQHDIADFLDYLGKLSENAQAALRNYCGVRDNLPPNPGQNLEQQTISLKKETESSIQAMVNITYYSEQEIEKIQNKYLVITTYILDHLADIDKVRPLEPADPSRRKQDVMPIPPNNRTLEESSPT